MIRKLSRHILKIWGWKLVGVIPAEKKYVVVAAPHTSNWDFVVGQLYFMSAGIKSGVMIKKELFFFPLGILLRALGGIPVDRREKSDIVNQMIRQFERSDSFILTLAPEGTRKKVSEWKTGFHRIATGANVPVLPGFFDYEKKVVGVGDLFYPSEDADTDMLKIKKFYKNITPKHPDKFSVGDIG